MNLVCRVEAKSENIPSLLEFFDKSLYNHITGGNRNVTSRLVFEETCIELVKNSNEGCILEVKVKKTIGGIVFYVSCPGSPINIGDNEYDAGDRILAEYSEIINQSYRSGVNRIIITVKPSIVQKLLINGGAILTGLIVGLLLNCLPDNCFYIVDTVTDILDSIIDGFVRFLRTLVPFTAFFAIISAIPTIKFKIENDRRLKRLVIGFYCFSIIAMFIGFILCNSLSSTLKTYEFDPDSYLDVRQMLMGDSTLDRIINAIPASLTDPFAINNPLPMLILAVLFGLASASIYGTTGNTIRQSVANISCFFNKAFEMLYSLIPFILFISAADDFAWYGIYASVYFLIPIAIIIIVLLAMFVVYMIYLLINGINPISFLKENKTLFAENYIIGSNLDAVSYNRRYLRRKLNKIPSPILSDGLYLGGLIDMVGTCAAITVTTCIVAIIFDIQLRPWEYIEIAITIFALSCGAPNLSGSFLIVMSILLIHLGVNSQAYSSIVITEACVARITSFFNSFGDIVGIFVCFKKDQTSVSD